MPTPLYIGMGPPYGVTITVNKTDDFDPLLASSATAITFEVTRPSGRHSSWAATIVAASASMIEVKYALASEDLDERGAWTCWVRFTLPGGGVLRSVVGKLPTILANDQASA